MNIYDCKVGDVVATGDSYGYSPCVCIKEKYHNENFGFTVVDFLNLTDGTVYESGAAEGFSTDECQRIERISPEQVEKIKKVWGVEC